MAGESQDDLKYAKQKKNSCYSNFFEEYKDLKDNEQSTETSLLKKWKVISAVIIK